MTRILVLTLALIVEFSAAATSKETKPVGPEKAAAADAAAVAKGNKPAPSATPASQLDMLKGEWTACRPYTNEAGEVILKGPTLGLKDTYSRVSSKSFTQAIGSASDKDCKKIVSETRTTFECDETAPELISCRTSKREERKGKGKWRAVTIKETDQYTIKVGITAKDADTIDVNIFSDESEGNETFELKRSKK